LILNGRVVGNRQVFEFAKTEFDIARADAGGAGHYASGLERGIRIGFVRHFHESDVPADREVTAARSANFNWIQGTIDTPGCT
jgi:hypothetical protein